MVKEPTSNAAVSGRYASLVPLGTQAIRKEEKMAYRREYNVAGQSTSFTYLVCRTSLLDIEGWVSSAGVDCFAYSW